MFRVVIHPDALAELDRIAAFHRKKIMASMREVLTQDPTSTKRSRVKKLKGGFWPPFRLRVGEFRVYYDVDAERREVVVLHVWEKGRASTPESIDPDDGPEPRGRRQRGRQHR